VRRCLRQADHLFLVRENNYLSQKKYTKIY
jgi:hypothetical protein